MSNVKTCTHIKVTGLRCGSPALSGEQFCYFHQNAHRGVRRPKQSRLHPIALIEDEESIQYALMEVMNALMRNTIDLKRAALILRALHIAVKNVRCVRYDAYPEDMVKKIPAYAAPPEHPTTEQAEAQAEITADADLPAVAANPHLHIGPEGPHYWEQRSEAARRQFREDTQRFAAEKKAREEFRQHWAEERAAEAKARAAARTAASANVNVGTAPSAVQARPQSGPADTTTRVGTDAFVRPAPPKASAPAPTQPAAVSAATVKRATPITVPPHDFKQQLAPPSQDVKSPQQPSTTSTKAQPTSTPPRKPPTPSIPTRKDQKHPASASKNG